jgi:hypothetical protein
VTHPQADTATVQFSLTDVLGAGGGGDTKWFGAGGGSYGPCSMGSLPTSCTFTIPAGGEWD